MLWLCIAAALCYAVFLPGFALLRKRHPAFGAACKGLATACALGVAVAAAVMGGGRLWMCVAALACCAVADVLLEGNLMLGMGAFICGHMWYILWFVGRRAPGMAHALIFLALAVCAALLLARWRKLIGSRMPPFIAYAVVLCVMGACGIACYQEASTAGLLAAFGAGLFVLSDMLVCHGIVQPTGRLHEALAMTAYEAAQLLLASSAAAMAGMI